MEEEMNAQVLRELAESVERVQQITKQHPQLQPLVSELMNGRGTATPVRATPARSRRMTAAQKKANSIRMKKLWKARKSMGKTSL